MFLIWHVVCLRTPEKASDTTEHDDLRAAALEFLVLQSLHVRSLLLYDVCDIGNLESWA